MKDVTYNKKILEVIKELSGSLIKQFKIRKIGEEISIRVKENSLGINVDFTTPVANLNIDSEVLGFAENVYSDFYKFFNLFNNPSLKQDGTKLILKENKQTIKFSPSNPDIIDNEFKGVKNLPVPTLSFNMDAEQFSYLEKMIKMISAQEVNFVAKGKTLDIIIKNDVNDNESTVSVELENETVEDLDLYLNTEIFKSAPNLNYTINVIPEARMFHFSSVNEDFTLNLYTGLRAKE